MLKNYFKTAARNVQRHKGYAFINLTGLAFGLGAGLTALGIALLTVSYQALKAALADPVERLAVRVRRET